MAHVQETVGQGHAKQRGDDTAATLMNIHRKEGYQSYAKDNSIIKGEYAIASIAAIDIMTE